ncbi:hypothetical protein H1W00_03705 [Aeromicrobium sp. Marseille-Q0843]|uniref:Integral membrane protein n=1 Tax=Aeromicrobium phoceense TaxID=2754045 RepID=A0A838XCD5_9ACTN|nr:hypothetical protein [Aeromicrobium phoceense]MBA4607572.1 hypothetical protein [Aeromicrobium phoceense]
MIGKLASWLLIAAGVFNIVIWPRFFKAIVDDDRAWGGTRWQEPTSFFWVHLVLIGTAMTLGVIVLVIGIRALRGQ